MISKTKPKTATTLHAYSVTPGKPKDYWTRIGAYFPHEDGDGGTVVLNALPITDRIVLRTPKAEVEAPAETDALAGA